MDKSNIVLTLIKNEYEKNGVVAEPRIIQMATILNIEASEVKSIIERLVWRGEIEKGGINYFLNKPYNVVR
ncbi:MAG: hypothetical protein ACE5K4_10935 [Candidatus Hydrothermarchaeota archaeon]